MRIAAAAAPLALAVMLTACGGGGGGPIESRGPTTTTSTVPATGSPLTIGIICSTPSDAARTVVDAWMAGEPAAAKRCATTAAVTTLFTRDGRGTRWTLQACAGPAAAPVCTYTAPGGTTRLTVGGSDAAGWRVQRVEFGA